MADSRRRAAFLAIGDELLDGRVRDRNLTFLARALGGCGFELGAAVFIGDPVAEIVEGLEFCASRAPLVVMTGGLGPTLDDRTRNAVAAWADRPLVFDEDAWTGIRNRFEKVRGLRAPESNRLQAWFPEGAEVLPNEVGTAPGFRLVRKGTAGPVELFVLPGVPLEARRMFEREVRPRLPATGRRRMQETLAFAGVSESEIGGLLAPYLVEGRRVRVGSTASYGLIRITLNLEGADEAETTAALEREASEIRKIGERWFLGRGGGEIEDFLGERLLEKGIDLALAESCTGGAAAARLTSVPGISGVFREAIVCYANESKKERLGVPADLLEREGAVSRACAEAMVRGLAARSGARLCGATTGIAGPGGGSPEKPVGLVWIATLFEGELRVYERRYGDLGRNRIRERAATDLLLALWKACGSPSPA